MAIKKKPAVKWPRSPYVALVRRRGTAVELPAKAYRGKTKHKKTLRAKAATRNLVSWRGKDRGVIAYAGYILGFAGDTPERIDQDIRIILDELPLDFLQFYPLPPCRAPRIISV